MGKSLQSFQDAANITSNNIANVNRPQFKRTDGSVKESLAATVPRADDSDQLAGAVTDPKHIPIGPEFEAKPFSVTSTLDDTQQMRVDGSNVDIDQEMAKLSLNSSYAQTMGGLLQNQYTRLRQAIQERF